VNRLNLVCVWTLALQRDGKIVIGGLFSSIGGIYAWNMGRLNSDGTADSSFVAEYGGARVLTLAPQADGKILAATPDLYRFDVDGSLDHSFEPPTAVGVLLALKQNGYVLSRTQDDHVVRLRPDGHLDPNFQATEIGDVSAIRLQNDEKVLVAYDAPIRNGAGIARLKDDGSVDRSFRAGFASGGSYRDMFLVQPDGNILLGVGLWHTTAPVDTTWLVSSATRRRETIPTRRGCRQRATTAPSGTTLPRPTATPTVRETFATRTTA